MGKMLRFCFVLIILPFAYGAEAEDKKIVKARVESSKGYLNYFQHVKGFVNEDIDLYPDTVTFLEVNEVSPIVKFFNAAGELVDKISLTVFPRDRLNLLLEKRGFIKRTKEEL